MREALVTLKKSLPEGDEASKVAFSTMLRYIGNVVGNPAEEKFRRIKLANEAFKKRVGCHPQALEFLQLCGFQVGLVDEGFRTKVW